jgi:hypothetical protein
MKYVDVAGSSRKVEKFIPTTLGRFLSACSAEHELFFFFFFFSFFSFFWGGGAAASNLLFDGAAPCTAGWKKTLKAFCKCGRIVFLTIGQELSFAIWRRTLLCCHLSGNPCSASLARTHILQLWPHPVLPLGAAALFCKCGRTMLCHSGEHLVLPLGRALCSATRASTMFCHSGEHPVLPLGEHPVLPLGRAPCSAILASHDVHVRYQGRQPP